MCQYCQPLIKAIDNYIAKVDSDLANKLDAAGFVSAEDTATYIELIESQLEVALLHETEYLLGEIEAAPNTYDLMWRWQEIRDADTLNIDVTSIFVENLSEFIPGCVRRYIAETDPELAYGRVAKGINDGAERISERTTAWIRSWSEDLGEIMKLDSYKEIEDILAEGLQNGVGVAEVARKIRDEGIRDEYYRARSVAVTEMLRAHSVAQQEAFDEDPSVEGKEWRHSGSYRNQPRENHVAMDGAIVPKDDTFTLYGADGFMYYPMYPRDTNLPPGESINCHCICQPVVNKDILGLSLEERQALQQQAIDEMDDKWEKELDARIRAERGIEIIPENDEDGKMFPIVHCDWSETEARTHSKEERAAFVDYAKEKSVNLNNVSHFDGDAEMLREQIDQVSNMANEYKITKKITVSFEIMEDDEFAVTRHNTIIFNTKALRNKEITNNALNADDCLASTSSNGIGAHEMGHLIENDYGNKGIDIAKEAYYNLNNERLSDLEIIDFLTENISTYATSTSKDVTVKGIQGRFYREVIPEVIAKDVTNPDSFTNEFVRLLKERIK